MCLFSKRELEKFIRFLKRIKFPKLLQRKRQLVLQPPLMTNFFTYHEIKKICLTQLRDI